MDHLLDSSALLAYLLDEPGAQLVADTLSRPAGINLLNWSEVLSYYALRGPKPRSVESRLAKQGLVFGLIELLLPEPSDALGAAELQMQHPDMGLSLADRFCLAMGKRLKIAVLTADRSWSKLPPSLSIKCIR